MIHNPQIIRDVVKISGCRFKIVPRPDQELEKEEVGFILLSESMFKEILNKI